MLAAVLQATVDRTGVEPEVHILHTMHLLADLGYDCLNLLVLPGIYILLPFDVLIHLNDGV